MRVAKRFRWEGAHRLPDHPGLCRNLHGHSFEMTAEVEGAVGTDGMVVDFHAIKAALAPLVEAFDHAILVGEDDAELLAVVRHTGWKHVVLPYAPTSENVARFAADVLCASDRLGAASEIAVRVQETETCYAVYARPVAAAPTTPADALAPFRPAAAPDAVACP